METIIWLTEVAPRLGRREKTLLKYIENASTEANPGLLRVALKMATGSGKTTVMAMIIAWQTINAVRRPASRRFTRSFLVVTPGITIRDRLRVLQPNDPDSYYASRELVPREDRHHQLPWIHASREHGAIQGRSGFADGQGHGRAQSERQTAAGRVTY